MAGDAAASPTSAVPVSLDVDEGMRAVVLVPQLGTMPAGLAKLAVDYAPAFVVPAQGRLGDPVPYYGLTDYWPTSVDVFLRRARIHTSWSRWSFVLVVLFGIAASFTASNISRSVPVVLFAASWCAFVYLTYFPKLFERSGEDTVQTVADNPRGGFFRHDILTMQSKMTSDAWGREGVWGTVNRDMETHADDGRPTIYARIVDGTTPLAIQYWLFYPYNDWIIPHEVDWEVVTVYFSPADDGWRPRAVAISCHLGGLWRPWDSVLRESDCRPLIFIAKGSHAHYFEATSEGFATFERRPFRLPVLEVSLGLSTGERDYVAQAPGRETERVEYTIQWMPRDRDDPQAAPWIKYRGRWGRRYPGGFILGPAEQGLKWTDPNRWAELACRADDGTWQALFAGFKADLDCQDD